MSLQESVTPDAGPSPPPKGFRPRPRAALAWILQAGGPYKAGEEEFLAYLNALRVELAPASLLEALLVEQVITAVTFLRRAHQALGGPGDLDLKWVRFQNNAERMLWKALNRIESGRRRPRTVPDEIMTAAAAPEPAASSPPEPSAPAAPAPDETPTEEIAVPETSTGSRRRDPHPSQPTRRPAELVAGTPGDADATFIDIRAVPPGPAETALEAPSGSLAGT